MLDYFRQSSVQSEDDLDSDCCENIEFYADPITNSDCDNELEGSYSDLINDYRSSGWMHSKSDGDIRNNPENTKDILGDIVISLREDHGAISKSQELQCSVDLIERQNTKDGIEDRLRLKLSNDTVNGYCEGEKQNQRKNSEKSETSVFDNIDIGDMSGVPLEQIVTWSAQLILALEALHRLGIICG